MVDRHADRHPAVVVANGYPLEHFGYLRVGKSHAFLVAFTYGDLAYDPGAETLLAGVKQQLRRLGHGVLAAG
ncbi:hypothetical protein D3C86_1183550 [compost metagenome]